MKEGRTANNKLFKSGFGASFIGNLEFPKANLRRKFIGKLPSYVYLER